MDLNTQFVFEGKLKRVLIGGMVLGVLCLLLTFINDDEYHTRFWTDYLHNAVFFTGIAFTAMFFYAAQVTAFSGWNAVIVRIWQALSQFMWVGMILLAVIVLGVWGHFHHLYHWNVPGINDPNSPLFDKTLAGKSGFLNPSFFTFAILGVLGIWYFWAFKLRQASVDQDTMETPSFDYYKKQRKWAASFLPLGGFLSTVFLWEAIMSVDPHWYSTMFAWYSMISLWLASMSITIMLIIYLKSKGYLTYVTVNHLHDIGKYLFGISVFWTYLWFDQFMLIWYANIGEETIYFKERMVHYPVLFWGNLLLNFVTPFFILMRNDTKRKFGTMFFVALIVFFGHWWDFFYMIKPGARIAAHEAKEISEGKVGKHHEAAPMSEAQGAKHEITPSVAENRTEATNPAEEKTADTLKDKDAHLEHAAAEQGPAAAEPSAPHPAEAEASVEPGGEAGGEEHGMVDESKSFKLGFTIPGLEEIGIMLGFLSLFLFFFFNQLQKAPLIPFRDPYLEESLHHDTGALIEGEDSSDDHH